MIEGYMTIPPRELQINQFVPLTDPLGELLHPESPQIYFFMFIFFFCMFCGFFMFIFFFVTYKMLLD